MCRMSIFQEVAVSFVVFKGQEPIKLSKATIASAAVRSLILGPLMGGPQCRLSILRNAHVPCYYFCKVHVDSKKVSCRISNLRKNIRHVYFYPHVTRLYVVC